MDMTTKELDHGQQNAQGWYETICEQVAAHGCRRRRKQSHRQSQRGMKMYTLGNARYCARNHAICDGPVVVARVVGNGYPVGTGWSAETEATARLLAAAPELLSMLGRAIRTAERDGMPGNPGSRPKWVGEARALIDRVYQP
jgi:hypothetical protein